MRRIFCRGGSTGYAIALAMAMAAIASRAVADLPAATTDPRVVLEASERLDTGNRVVARVRMTITDGGGARRERVLASRSLRASDVTKTLIFVESPAEIRGTGLLSVDHRGATRDDEQWLYLPSVHRATRIASSGRSGAFLGSDFSYGDLTTVDPDDFELRMIEANAVVDGEPTWQIEATPRSAAIRDRIGYRKIDLWISKRSLLPIRSKGFLPDGRVKFIALLDVRRVDGIETPHRLVARTMRGSRRESETVLERTSVRIGDASVTDADFTVPRLERGP